MTTDDTATQRTRPPEIPKKSDIPEQLGKYLLQDEIGRGTCGVAFLHNLLIILKIDFLQKRFLLMPKFYH
jgi:hypothetical protein